MEEFLTKYLIYRVIKRKLARGEELQRRWVRTVCQTRDDEGYYCKMAYSFKESRRARDLATRAIHYLPKQMNARVKAIRMKRMRRSVSGAVRRSSRINKTTRKHNRRWWVRPLLKKRDEEGCYHAMMNVMRKTDTDSFHEFTRMSVHRYDDLLALMSRALRKNPKGRKALSPGHRLAITLRFLATGENFKVLANAFRIGIATARCVTLETCEALWNVLRTQYMPLPTGDAWKEVANDFGRLWKFPNCCGAVHGMRVAIKPPKKTGCEETDAVVVSAVVDARYRFLVVDFGKHGSSSDGGIFHSSPAGESVWSDTLGLPVLCFLQKTSTLPFADVACQLGEDVMYPNPARTLFNDGLSRARRCSENAFGILASRWGVFKHRLVLSPKYATAVTLATLVLHNYLLKEEAADATKIYCPPEFADCPDEHGGVCDGQWRAMAQTDPAKGLEHLPNSADSGIDLGIWKGEVPWQWQLPGDP